MNSADDLAVIAVGVSSDASVREGLRSRLPLPVAARRSPPQSAAARYYSPQPVTAWQAEPDSRRRTNHGVGQRVVAEPPEGGLEASFESVHTAVEALR